MKFRMSDGTTKEGDFQKDTERLREKALDKIDDISKDEDGAGFWVELRCILEDIFTKEQPSINQLKKDLKDNLKKK